MHSIRHTLSISHENVKTTTTCSYQITEFYVKAWKYGVNWQKILEKNFVDTFKWQGM